MTTAALAAEVGITDGTIFRHFRNKDEIVEAAIDLFEETLGATYPPPGGEPLARLGSFLVNRLTLVRENPQVLRLAFNDRLEEAAGAAGAARVEQLVGRSVSFVRGCLAAAQSRGEITRETPLTLLVWMVIGVVRGAATVGPHHGHDAAPARDAAHAHDAASLGHASAADVWQSLERFLRSTVQGD